MLLRLIRSGFSRRAHSSEGSYEQINQYKWRQFVKYAQRYESDQNFQHEDKFYEEFVYGHTCHIAAVTQHSFQSQKFSKSIMKYAKPKVLILGGLSDNYLRYGQAQLGLRQKYDHPLYKPEKMICKQRISKYIQAKLEKDPCFLWDDRKKEMIYINHKDKRIMPADYLTVAHMASIQGDTSVVLGKPSDTLVFQDIIMRYSLAELKEIVARAVEKVKSRQQESINWRQSYTLQAIQNYAMSEQSSIYSRELTYQAALLKRFAKVQDKVVLLTPGYFVHRIAEQVHHIEVKPQNVFRDGLSDRNSESYTLLQQVLKSNPQEILQKFSLICLLKQNWIQNQFAMGQNVFRHMCFGEIFKNIDIVELKTRYQKAKEQTGQKWFQLMRQRINNIHILPQPHIRHTLSQQFKILQERATQHFPYTYESKNFLSEHEDNIRLAKLEDKMRQMLNQQGDPHNIQLFDKFTKGYRSREGILLYSKLLGKANIESEERIKLPIFHYSAFRGIYKEYLRQFILKAEQNSQIEKKVKKRLGKIEDMMEKHMKKLENPNQLHDLITGKKGKALQITLDPEQGPQFSPEDLEELKDMFGNMNEEDEKQMEQEFGDEWNKKK